MKLSIITINYNNCAGLKKTIDSVVAQTFTDYEWIVIDGGSTDGSKELIEENSRRFSFWCSEPDKGIYNAMNKGIDHANGEYFQFLNSGDWLLANDTLFQVFSKVYHEDVIFGDFKYEGYSYIKKFPDHLTISFLLNDCINHQSTFLSSHIFDEYRYDESFKIVSDWALYFKLLLEGKKFKHVNIPIVSFNLDGVGSTLSKNHLIEKENAKQKYIPQSIREDLFVLEKYGFVSKRKLFRAIMKLSLKLCELMEPILLKIETNRKKRGG